MRISEAGKTAPWRRARVSFSLLLLSMGTLSTLCGIRPFRLRSGAGPLRHHTETPTLHKNSNCGEMRIRLEMKIPGEKGEKARRMPVKRRRKAPDSRTMNGSDREDAPQG